MQKVFPGWISHYIYTEKKQMILQAAFDISNCFLQVFTMCYFISYKINH